MDINFDPEAFSDEWQERQELLREMAQEVAQEVMPDKTEIIGMVLDLAIAKLTIELAARGEDVEIEYWDESMDGDHESALASAGFGTDEDYGGGTHDWEDGGDYWAD
jgi:hypothetical protein